MGTSTTVSPFPLARRDAPTSTDSEVIDAVRAGDVTSLSAVRRQRAFEAAPGRLHDFEVDVFTAICGVLKPKQRAEVIAFVAACAKFPDNEPYALAANNLLRRLGDR